MTGNYSFSSKAYNFRTVLEVIRMKGPIPRAEIARLTDLTAQSISNITRRLLEHELIKETTKVQEGRGAPSTNLVINPQGAYSIGLDIDHDHLSGILMDFSGKVLQRQTHTLTSPEPEATVALMLQTIDYLQQQESLEKHQIWGIGIGVPGPLETAKGSLATNVAHAKAVRGWNEVPIVQLVHKETALPVYLENNATASAIGEQWFGMGHAFHSYFYMYMGLGLGGGLILNKLPFRGFSGNAGEIGFIPKSFTPSNNEPFAKNHVGIHFDLVRLMDRLKRDYHVEHVKDLVALFDNQNPLLMEWMDEGARVLVPLLLSIEYLLDPEAIIVGGRLPIPIMTALVEKAQTLLPSNWIEEQRIFPRVILSQLEDDAVALGVATIPLYEMLTPLASLFSSHNATAATQPLYQHRPSDTHYFLALNSKTQRRVRPWVFVRPTYPA